MIGYVARIDIFVGLISLPIAVIYKTDPDQIFDGIPFIIIKIWLFANVISLGVIAFLWIAMIFNCIYNLNTIEEESIYIRWLILLIFFNFLMAPIYYFKKFKKHKKVITS